MKILLTFDQTPGQLVGSERDANHNPARRAENDENDWRRRSIKPPTINGNATLNALRELDP